MHFGHALRGARDDAREFTPVRRLDERGVEVATSNAVTDESEPHDAYLCPQIKVRHFVQTI
jgi:hypothetical protein